MQKFNSKNEVFDYLKNKFLVKGVRGIVIVGSTAKGKIKDFSDIDVVVFNVTKLKPYYELCTVGKNLVLITVYFYLPGNKKTLPKNGKIIYGHYFEQIEHKGNTKYTKQERIKRDSQMFLDGLFKFIRSKDPKYLKWIEKYSRI